MSNIFKITVTLLLICSLFSSIESRPRFGRNKPKRQHKKKDIKSLMGLLDSYFDKKEAPESEDTAETETEEIPTNELVAEEERSAARGDEVIGVVGPELKQGLEQVHGEEPVIQEAHSGLIRNTRIIKYKVSRYTLDHELRVTKQWMNKGFQAWTNPEATAYLRARGCPALQFVETRKEDYDFRINFDFDFWDGWNSDGYFSLWMKKDKTIYFNDYLPLKRHYIAHGIAYDTCKMLGCPCTRGAKSSPNVMNCSYNPGWPNYKPTLRDYATLATALGC